MSSLNISLFPDASSDSSALASTSASVAVIGGGPAGLMAAQVLAAAGHTVTVFDAKPSLGRKFLRAGIGGLNLTHSEPFNIFCQRFDPPSQPFLQPALDAFPPASVRQWAASLGVETFEGSSGKVFPVAMKAAPLLRAWVQRLRQGGVQFRLRHYWQGWNEQGVLRFDTPDGVVEHTARATVLALGGGSWPQLGSDGQWVQVLSRHGVDIAPLHSTNCGFEVAWSDYVQRNFHGEQLKAVAVTVCDEHGQPHTRRGELIVSRYGVEGSLIYAFSRWLRLQLLKGQPATLTLDLLPDRSIDYVLQQLQHPRGSRSLSSHLQSRLGLKGVKVALLHELLDKSSLQDPVRLAQAIKALTVTLGATRPINEAISTAGGVCFQSVNASLMLQALPGVFVAGEMLDWEAPTGGYLLTACLAQGVQAGQGAVRWLAETQLSQS